MATLPIETGNENGRAQHSVRDRRFPILDSRKIWTVSRGKVDVFLQIIDEEHRAGARFFIMRAGEGDAILGIDVNERPYVNLIACPHPGTEFSCRRLEDVFHPRRGGDPTKWMELVERWIAGLYLRCQGEIVPHNTTMLHRGCVVSTTEETAIVPEEQIVWAKHLKGESQFLGQDVTVGSSEPFPLSRLGRGWIRAAKDSLIEGLDFTSVLREDPHWRGLQQFHSAVLTCLLVNRENQESRKQQDIVKQQQSDAALIHRTLMGLASPLNKQVAERVASAGVSSDPILLACYKIGSELGINFKAAPAKEALGSDQARAVEIIAKASGVRHRRVLLRSNWWREDNGPLLAFVRETNRPVALLPRRGGYKVYDPVAGSSARIDDVSWLEPFAYSFYRPFPLTKLTGRDLFLFALRSVKAEFLMVVVMGIAGGLSSMVVPIVTGLIFDSVIPGADRGQLLELTGFLLVAAIATALFSLVRSFAVIRMEGRIDSVAQPAMWDRVLRLPVPFFRNYSAGDLAVRSLAVNQIRQVLTNSTLASILSGIFSVFSFALLFYYSWRLALLATALVGAGVLVSLGCGYVQLRYVRQMTRMRGRISSMLLQFINGVAKFRISGSEKRAFAAWSNVFANQKRLYLNGRRASNVLAVFQSSFPILALALIFTVAAGMVGQSAGTALTTGSFLAFLVAFTQLLASTMQLSSSVSSILNIVPLYERAMPILQTLPEVEEGQSSPGELQGGIEVSHLNFRYTPDGPLALHDVCFHVRPGEFVAFTGPSGSGKSTLLRLLLGFETPESGAISFDGHDLTGIDVQALRQQIGVVMQSGRLTSGSILENIIGSSHLTLDHAWDAARLAGLDRDIKAMPMGMHTVVSDGGGGFSGGQRQRLMIARAVVRKPRILFFDEATSALDNQTQAIVGKSLEKLQSTRVVIAHRLSTIMNADRIFVFDRGSIVQSGKYEELLEQPGLFRDLVRRQVA
jgi:NHLM bacteriocin system ABC transporter ATP-binding protein